MTNVNPTTDTFYNARRVFEDGRLVAIDFTLSRGNANATETQTGRLEPET